MSKRLALGLLLSLLLAGCQTDSTPRLQSLAALTQQQPTPRRLPIADWRTTQGTRVLFVPAPELPMFDVRLVFAAGSSRDAPAKDGLALLTNALVGEGNAERDATAIAQGFEQLGAEFSSSAHRDMALVSLRSLSARAQREPAVQLLAEVLRTPSFAPQAEQRIKNQLLASFEQDKQNPGKQAGSLLFQKLYGTHPYAHPREGSKESLARIQNADIQRFYRRAYSSGNALIALVGDLSRGEAEAIAEQLAAALPQGTALPPLPAPVAPAGGESHIEYPSQQTHLLLAGLGIARGDADWPALYLGNQILGGGFGSRLTEEVREKRGLTYGIYSGFTPMAVNGPFIISAQTRAEQSAGTLRLAREILADFIENGPSAAELAAAKRELSGSYPLSLASNDSIAGQLAALAFYDLPLDQLERFIQQTQALTVQDIKAAFARHIDMDRLITVTAGPSTAQQPLPPPTVRARRSLPVPEH